MLAFIARIALLVWLIGSVWLFFSPSFAPGLNANYDFLARAIEALHAGMVQTPRLMLRGGFWVVGFLGSVYQDVLRDLKISNPSSLQSPSVPIGSLPKMGPLLGLAIWVGIILSLVQFVSNFLIMAFSAHYVWRFPGLPHLLRTPARIIYFAATLSVSAYLILNALNFGIFPLFVVAVTCALVMRFPIVAGLPIWVLDIVLRLPPSSILRLPKGWFTRQNRSQQSDFSSASNTSGFRSSQSHDRSRARGTGPKQERSSTEDDKSSWSSYQKSNRSSNQSNKQSENTAPPADTSQKYNEACELFGLTPSDFTQEQLKTRYKEVAKKNHPDGGGSGFLMGLTNSAYETVLNHHGWKR